MKSVLVLSVSDLGRDPRVHRQLNCLAESYKVTAAGLAPPNVDGVHFIRMTPQNIYRKLYGIALLALRQYQTYYWSRSHVLSTLAGIQKKKFDVIIANDLNTLPLALRLAGGGHSTVVFDAHEYSPKEFDDNLLWRMLFMRYADTFCRRYLPEADAMMTVCKGIADEYAANYGAQPIVVTNAPDFQHLVPAPVDPSRIRMVHHGAALPARHLETMIKMMEYLDDRFTLDFMLMPSKPAYLEKLKRMAARNQRIRFLPPVLMAELPAVCNHYDVGVYLLPPVNFNHEHALPNKFFEFVQARLAIAIGPSPEMAALVRAYDCGIVGEDFSPASMARALSAITPEKLRYYKERSNVAASELCAENNQQLIKSLVEV